MKGAGKIKKSGVTTIFDKYIENQIERSATEDNVFLFAKKLVRAKDEEGIDLFWDREEEDFLRRFIEYTETMSEC